MPTNAVSSPSPAGGGEQRRRRIWLCADDYGMAPGVNAAICALLAQRRINATSVMVGAPSFDAETAAVLARLAAEQGIKIGLHVTLTAPFSPLAQPFAGLRAGRFLSVGRTLIAAMLRQFDPDALLREVETQLEAFSHAFGQPPDFIDGHGHVHLFPQVRDAVLATTKRLARTAWVRQCGRADGTSAPIGDPKGLLIAALSRGFRRRASALGIATNPAFAGTYTYGPAADFAALFPGFLANLPDGGLVMCHPGHVDAELERLDPLTVVREREYVYLAGDRFPQALAAAGVELR